MLNSFSDDTYFEEKNYSKKCIKNDFKLNKQIEENNSENKDFNSNFPNDNYNYHNFGYGADDDLLKIDSYDGNNNDFFV